MHGCRSCDSYSGTGDKENVVKEINGDLIVYYPQFGSIDFQVGEYPDRNDSSIIFCCAASFTRKRRFIQKEDNVAGPYVTKGKYHCGYEYGDNTSAFVSWNKHWEFISDTTLRGNFEECCINSGSAFSQMPIIVNYEPYRRENARDFLSIGNWHLYKDNYGNILLRRKKHRYRALCEKDNRLCIVELKKKDTYEKFVYELIDFDIENAIYLDVGRGWSYGWYRDRTGQIHNLDPYVHPFVSNWLIFKK